MTGRGTDLIKIGQQMENLQDYMTIPEICAAYNVSDSTVRRKVVIGLPKYKIIGNSALFYKKTDVAEKMAIQRKDFHA